MIGLGSDKKKSLSSTSKVPDSMFHIKKRWVRSSSPFLLQEADSSSAGFLFNWDKCLFAFWTLIIRQAHLFNNQNKIGCTIPGWPVRMDYWLRSSSVLLHWYVVQLQNMLFANIFGLAWLWWTHIHVDVSFLITQLRTCMFCSFIRSCRCESSPGLRNKFKRSLERTWWNILHEDSSLIFF